MNLTPLGPAHPALNPVGLTSSVKRCVQYVCGQWGRGELGVGLGVFHVCCVANSVCSSCLQRGQSATRALEPYVCVCCVCSGCCSTIRWLEWYPAAAAALVTGCYALLAGLALLLAPKTVLGAHRLRVSVGHTATAASNPTWLVVPGCAVLILQNAQGCCLIVHKCQKYGYAWAEFCLLLLAGSISAQQLQTTVRFMQPA